jgi:DNA-binding CsgD family transcriptional regulator
MGAIRIMLLDREAEREALDHLVIAAGGGLSGALVLHGEAGMGKTALLDHLVATATGLRPIRVTGQEAESEFGFAALHRLLGPLLGNLDELPTPQRDALGAAFGLIDHAPADLFLVGLATLTLLASSATDHGLLCIVDDAQWVDSESLSALAFVSRRLHADGIAMIFGYRTFEFLPPVLAGIPEIRVGGLPNEAAIELLTSGIRGPIDSNTANRIVVETSGCPLALAELAADLTSGQLARTDPLSEPIPISRRLEAHFLEQVDSLPPSSKSFLLVAAAETTGDTFLVRRVARELGCEPDAEDVAVRNRLLATEPSIQFRHPLIRSAVYGGADPAERRRVHSMLAETVDRSVEPDRWARHLAASTTGPDDNIASDLEGTARLARDRGGYAAEALLLIRAAELTGGTAQRSERLLGASKAALSAGAPDRAEVLLRQAQPGLTAPLLVAEARQLEGRLRMYLSLTGSVSALVEAARRFLPLDVDRARDSMLEAFDAYILTQHLTQDIQGVEIAELALTTRSGSGGGLADLLLEGTSLLVTSGIEAAVGVLRAAARLLREGPTSTDEIIRLFNYGIVVANELADERTYLEWAQRVEAVARQQGALIVLQTILPSLAEHHIRSGQFAAAEAEFAECVEVAGAISAGMEQSYRPLSGTLSAWRGQDDETRSSAQMMIDVGQLTGSAVQVFLGYRALALLELGHGNYAAAAAAAEQVTKEEAIGWKFQLLPIVIEGSVRSGSRTAAQRALAELERKCAVTATPWALGVLARCQALMAEDAAAEALFEEALLQLDKSLVVTDRALAQLSYGEWLRRQRRRVDARVQLRLAHEAFSSMGAAGFAERARLELLATGERVTQRSREMQVTLTAQELQIATLASEGATNPEIAAKLFLSTSTVDYHLRKVFRKLGITSRRQLDRALPT